MKPVNLYLSMYINFNKENNQEGPKFKVHHHVRISKSKNIFAKFFKLVWRSLKFTKGLKS